MRLPIVLLGPICAGKSTVATLLSVQMCLPRVELDEIRWPYYEEAGYDRARAAELVGGSGGLLDFLSYCKPFEAYAVERVLADSPDSIIDFGAGHSVYEDPVLFDRVQYALAPVPGVILLVPSPDEDVSISILNARFAALLQREVGVVDSRLLDLNAHFVRHPSNRRLAKHIVYTHGKSAGETVEEILQAVNRR